MSGKKRASPGADTEKNPLENTELSDENAQKLQDIQKQFERAELILERRGYETLWPVYEKRREIAKAVPKFWPIALMNHPLIGFQAQHNIDRVALSYLEDLWVERDTHEPRCFTLEFHFKPNPYFTDSVLKKEYKYVPPPEAAGEQPDEDGLTPSMLAFTWTRDVKPSAIKINWKDAASALTKLHPRVEEEDAEEEDVPAEAGSFFNFFELAPDPFDIGTTIANEVFVEGTDYFLGKVSQDEMDSEDEESEDDDDDAEEIDLEKPRPKKQKKD
ncbi:hypothetical protein V8E55_000789 [Tylopilus felleus]|jgi:template-activating factor I